MWIKKCVFKCDTSKLKFERVNIVEEENYKMYPPYSTEKCFFKMQIVLTNLKYCVVNNIVLQILTPGIHTEIAPKHWNFNKDINLYQEFGFPLNITLGKQAKII